MFTEVILIVFGLGEGSLVAYFRNEYGFWQKRQQDKAQII